MGWTAIDTAGNEWKSIETHGWPKTIVADGKKFAQTNECRQSPGMGHHGLVFRAKDGSEVLFLDLNRIIRLTGK